MRSIDSSSHAELSHERIVELLESDKPAIRFYERRGIGGYTAVFAMELSGVMRRTGERKGGKTQDEQISLYERFRGALMNSLSEGKRLDFVYTAGRDRHANSRFIWRIYGQAMGVERNDAERNAMELYRNIEVALGTARNEYCFTPIRDENQLVNARINSGWSAQIIPAGVELGSVKHKRVGFGQDFEHTDSCGRIIVSPYRTSVRKRFDAVALGALSCPEMVQVRVTLTPILLSRAAIKAVKRALAHVRSGGTSHLDCYPANNGGKLVNAELEMLEKALDLWSVNPSGIRIECNVVSLKPVPKSFLAMIGEELFHGAPVSVRIQGENTSLRDGECLDEMLDLRGCVNIAEALPPLFPAVEMLLERGAQRIYGAAIQDMARSGIVLGYVGEGAIRREVRLSEPDRTRHTYIVGGSGSGKSTLLFNMIMQDIENNRGVALIDPHGDLFSQILEEIPRRRRDDVVLMDLTDFEHSVGMNFLECTGPLRTVQVNFVVNEMIKIIDRLYDLKQNGGPIFEQYIRNAMLLRIDSDEPGGTLLDIPYLLSDRDYRNYLKKRCTDPLVVSFWTKEAERAGGDASLANIVPYVSSKLNQFTTNRLIRPIIGQVRSTIDFRKSMDQGNILLINLAKGLIGEVDCQMLGMLLIGKLYSSAMGRVTQRPEERRQLNLYIDEAQNFVTDSVAHLLSESRKFGLSLTLANQNLSQLLANKGQQNILESVLANVGNLLLLRLGVMDAEKLESYARPALSAADLQELPDFHVAGRLLNRNVPGRTFVFRTNPALELRDRVSADMLVNRSRMLYTQPKRRVEAEIAYSRKKKMESES